jgi:hypothetical protein
VFNNEVGFKEKHVRAVCDIGNSTKSGKAKQKGYIGEKICLWKKMCGVVYDDGMNT